MLCGTSRSNVDRMRHYGKCIKRTHRGHARRSHHTGTESTRSHLEAVTAVYGWVSAEWASKYHERLASGVKATASRYRVKAVAVKQLAANVASGNSLVHVGRITLDWVTYELRCVEGDGATAGTTARRQAPIRRPGSDCRTRCALQLKCSDGE